MKFELPQIGLSPAALPTAGNPKDELATAVGAARDWQAMTRDLGQAALRAGELAEKLASYEVESGIAIFDVAFAIENDELAATAMVKRLVDGKRIAALPIGKCPRDGRRQIYKLSEILSDVAKICALTEAEQTAMAQQLMSQLRKPRPG